MVIFSNRSEMANITPKFGAPKREKKRIKKTIVIQNKYKTADASTHAAKGGTSRIYSATY